MNKKTIWGVAVIIVVIIIILVSRNTQNTSTIKIGAILPLTGIAAVYGENQSNAILMAVDEINRSGGVLGNELEIVLEDDATDPKKDISAFQKLTDVDKVSAIIGADWDIMANAIMPMIDDKKVVVISPTASPDILDKTAQYFFTTIAPVSIHQFTVEKYLRQEAGNKVAIMYVAGGWGIAHRETYKKAIAATGKTLVAEVNLIKFDGNDLQREVSLLKSSKPDIILAAVNFVDSKALVEKNYQLGPNSRIFGHTNIATVHIDQGIDKTALSGAVVYRLAPPESQFIADYKKLYGKEPVSDSDKAYDAVYLIARAIELSKDASPAGIFSGLKRISDFEGVAGPIDYTKANWPTKDTAHLEIFDGNNFVPYLSN